jgi:hypothetical protein
MTRHVGAETLARYREGDLRRRRLSQVRAHLAGCPRCAALDKDLARVTTLLASVPAPAMPPQVTDRIQAALAAEPALSPAGGRHVSGQPGHAGQAGHAGHAGQPQHTGQPQHAGRGWRLPALRSALVVRGAAVAAAAVVIAGGVYGTIQLTAGGQPGASLSAPGAAAGPARLPAASVGPSLSYVAAGKKAGFTPVSTGTDFQPRQLRSQVRSVLQPGSGNGGSPVNPAPGVTPGPDAAPIAHGHGAASGQSFAGLPVAVLQGCVTRIAGGSRVLLVDVSSYQGRPATVIVTAAPGGGSRIWVAGPGCSRSDSDLIARSSLPAAG